MWPDEYLESGYSVHKFVYENIYNTLDKSCAGNINYNLYGDIRYYFGSNIYAACKELKINYWDE